MQIGHEGLPIGVIDQEQGEVLGRTNLFSAFVEERAGDFAAFNASIKELKETRKAWRTSISPLVDDVVAAARRDFMGFNSKGETQLRSLVVGGILDMEGQDTDPESELHFILDGRRRVVAPPGTARIRYEFREATLPIVADLNESQVEVADDLETRMHDRYGFIVDMKDFLDQPAFGQQRELISGIFRNIAELERIRQTGNKPGIFQHLRAEWQNRAENPDESVNPEVFARFWMNVNQSKDIPRLVSRFGSALRMLKRARNEEGAGQMPTMEEIRELFSQVPISEWDPEIREAYVKFFKDDIAGLIATISSKIRELYPKAAERQVYVPEDSGNGTHKRKHFGGGMRGSNGGAVNGDNGNNHESNGSEVAKEYGLAIVKKDPTGRFTHASHPILPEEIELCVERMAEYGFDDRMKADLRIILRSLIDKPRQPGTRMLSKPKVTFSLEGHRAVPWRRFDPNGMRDVAFQHPETTRQRILFALVDDVVMIRRIISHTELDQLQTGSGSREI